MNDSVGLFQFYCLQLIPNPSFAQLKLNEYLDITNFPEVEEKILGV